MTEVKRRTITVVTPVFNEEASLPSYLEKVNRVLLSDPRHDYRILFVDDGSLDGSWSIIERAASSEPRVEGIRLSRNFGSHIALSAGIQMADSDAVATLACDLQDPPETVLDMAAAWEDGAQVVWAHRRSRGDSIWRRVGSRLFCEMIRRWAMPRGSKFTTGSFLLMDRLVAECVRRFPERHRITFALVAWTGFEQATVSYDRAARAHGASTWTLARMMKAIYDTFIGFSRMPARLATLIGLAVSCVAALLGMYVTSAWLTGNPLPGYTSVMLAISFFFGVQFLILGLMGEYLYRIYSEVVHRPLYFVSRRTCESLAQKDDGSTDSTHRR